MLKPMDKYISCGIDFGGYDGTTFAACIMQDKVVLDVFQCRDKEVFRAKVSDYIRRYGSISFLIEINTDDKDVPSYLHLPNFIPLTPQRLKGKPVEYIPVKFFPD